MTKKHHLTWLYAGAPAMLVTLLFARAIVPDLIRYIRMTRM